MDVSIVGVALKVGMAAGMALGVCRSNVDVVLDVGMSTMGEAIGVALSVGMTRVGVAVSVA